jgi:hypothetical protein
MAISETALKGTVLRTIDEINKSSGVTGVAFSVGEEELRGVDSHSLRE